MSQALKMGTRFKIHGPLYSEECSSAVFFSDGRNCPRNMFDNFFVLVGMSNEQWQCMSHIPEVVASLLLPLKGGWAQVAGLPGVLSRGTSNSSRNFGFHLRALHRKPLATSFESASTREYIHARIHIHAYIPTYIHTYRQTDRQADIHTYICYICTHSYEYCDGL